MTFGDMRSSLAYGINFRESAGQKFKLLAGIKTCKCEGKTLACPAAKPLSAGLSGEGFKGGVR